MYLISFVCFCLCTLALSAILARCVPLLRSSVLAYGKLHSIAAKPTNSIASQLAQWTVPKSWFAHFYVIGLLSALYCFAEIAFLLVWNGYGPVLYCLRVWDVPQASYHISVLESLVALALLTIHLARRVYESFYIERPSLEARMHVSHYIAGVGFYGAMVLATWLEGAANLNVWTGEPIAVLGKSCVCGRIKSLWIHMLFPSLEWSTLYTCRHGNGSILLCIHTSTSMSLHSSILADQKRYQPLSDSTRRLVWMDCGTTLFCRHSGVLITLHTTWLSQLDPDMWALLDSDQFIHHSFWHWGMVQGQIWITLSSYFPQGSLDHPSRHLLSMRDQHPIPVHKQDLLEASWYISGDHCYS